jgi:hypothetical protein
MASMKLGAQEQRPPSDPAEAMGKIWRKWHVILLFLSMVVEHPHLIHWCVNFER